MIDLTLPQAFVSGFLNVFELIIIYRLVTGYLNRKIILVDFLASLVIICVPVLEGSLEFPLIMIYLWLFDRKHDRQQIIYNKPVVLVNFNILKNISKFLQNVVVLDLIEHCKPAICFQIYSLAL